MVCLAQPCSSAELSFAKFDDEIRREELQSMLFLQKYTFLFPPPPPLPPMREMAIDVEHYKCPLIAFFNDQLMYFQDRLQGTYWDILTAADWIRLHKTKWALWQLGVRGKPATRFTNVDEVKLVLRGDGNHPPRTLEEDREHLHICAVSAVKYEQRRNVWSQCCSGDDKRESKRRSLPWSAYKQKLKAARSVESRAWRMNEVAARVEFDVLRKGELLDLAWREKRVDREDLGLDKLRAANNPRRAREQPLTLLKKRRERLTRT